METKIIETAADFCEELKEFYPAYNRKVLESICSYLDSHKNLDSFAMIQIFKEVTRTFKVYKWRQYPDLKEIIDIINQSNLAISRPEIINVKDAIVRLRNIKARLDKGEWKEIPIVDREYYYKWDYILTEYNELIRLGIEGQEIKAHLEKMAEAISTATIKGENPLYAVLPIMSKYKQWGNK